MSILSFVLWSVWISTWLKPIPLFHCYKRWIYIVGKNIWFYKILWLSLNMEIKCSANLLDIRIDMISQIRLYEMVTCSWSRFYLINAHIFKLHIWSRCIEICNKIRLFFIFFYHWIVSDFQHYNKVQKNKTF